MKTHEEKSRLCSRIAVLIMVVAAMNLLALPTLANAPTDGNSSSSGELSRDFKTPGGEGGNSGAPDANPGDLGAGGGSRTGADSDEFSVNSPGFHPPAVEAVTAPRERMAWGALLLSVLRHYLAALSFAVR